VLARVHFGLVHVQSELALLVQFELVHVQFELALAHEPGGLAAAPFWSQ
jgi:hypothetical protein